MYYVSINIIYIYFSVGYTNDDDEEEARERRRRAREERKKMKDSDESGTTDVIDTNRFMRFKT